MRRGPVRAVGFAAALWAGGGGLPSTAQQPGIIRGTVEIGATVRVPRPSSVYTTRAVPPAGPAVGPELRNVVVFLRDAPPRPVAPVRVDIRQRNETFMPRVVAVPVGSTVAFPNDDPLYHNVFSLSRTKAFNLGRYPRGETDSVRVDRPGIVKVFCDIHSHMSATILVFDHPWFAVPDEDGRFEMTAVPPGDQRVTAWHERLGEVAATVRVDPGRVVSAELALPAPRK